MKTLSKTGLLIALILLGLSSYGSTLPVTLPTELSNQIKVNRIASRLEEIKAMDKSNLTPREKRALRKELKEMKHEQQAASPDDDGGSGGGVYLSLGAIIIIILLLIIIL